MRGDMNYQDKLQEILKRRTKKEASKMLGVSVRSIQNYMLHGKLPLPYIVRKIEELHTELYKNEGG
jgi:hypothetical protein